MSTEIMFPLIENHIDSRMPKIPNPKSSFKSLFDELRIDLMTDLEKIRTLFLWICYQDFHSATSMKLTYSHKEVTPFGFIKEIVDKTKTVGDLFEFLMKEALIPCIKITGFIKKSSWFPDHKFSTTSDPSHDCWHAVFVDGHWRFIDVKRALPSSILDKDKKFVRGKIEEFYFLPDPQKLINTHYPDDKNWQLLPIPKIVKFDDYEAAPKTWPAYYTCGMKLPENLPGNIEVTDASYVTLELEIPEEVRNYESYKCELLTRDGMKKKVGKEVLTRHILHYTDETKDIVQVFLPSKGKYILEIYTMSNKVAANNFNVVAIYQLNCCSRSQTQLNLKEVDIKPPFPNICSYFGLGPHAYSHNIGLVKPQDSIIKCNQFNEGKVTIFYPRFDLEGKEINLEFVQNVFDSDSSQDRALADRVLQTSRFTDSEIETTFLVRCPCEGNSALILYLNTSFDSGKPNYVDVAHFLICQKNRGYGSLPPPFPHTRHGKVGPTQLNLEELCVKLVAIYPIDGLSGNSSDESWINCDEYGECLICFEHDQPLQFVCDKTDEQIEVLIECTPSLSYIQIRCNHAEIRKQFLFKVYAAPVDQVENIPQIYSFMINVFKPAKRSLPLPKCPSYYWGGVQNKLQLLNANINGFSYSESWTQHKFRVKRDNQVSIKLPCRFYEGGEDMEVEVGYNAPFAIKPKLKMIHSNGNTSDQDHYCISEHSSLEMCSVKIRFPEKGVYVLALFGTALGGDLNEQLTPFYYSLIIAEEASKKTKPFPKTYALWSASCHVLTSALRIDHFKQGVDTDFEVELFNFHKKHDYWVREPFAEVFLLVDSKKMISPRPGSMAGKYKWTYKPSSDNNHISVAVMPKPGSDEVLYALQYDVVS